MRSIRGFYPNIKSSTSQVIIDGEYHNYFKNVLRLKIGDNISLFNNIDSNEYDVEIIEISNKSIVAKINKYEIMNKENSYIINLFQSIIKNENFDLVIQKATELGINTITPLITERTNHKFDKNHFDKKLERWEKIAINATEQCGRVFVPEIKAITTIDNIKHSDALNITLCPYTKNSNEISTQIISNHSFNIFIGPEGGFTSDEIQLLTKQPNSISINLGTRILKSETAHINISSIINFLKNI
jgi:16S rRNA (uracil1498-N3)-methyltransferase